MTQTPTPPLLLTKRLTNFLSASLTPQLHTLLLTTQTGKLLAHATRPIRPVSELRAQSTVASSLVTLHASTASSIPAALGNSASPPVTPSSGSNSATLRGDDSDDGEGSAQQQHQNQQLHQHGLSGGGGGNIHRAACGAGRGGAGTKPVGITVQLSGGVVVVRRLNCGLLFVCIGPVEPQRESRGREGRDGPPESVSASGSGSPDEVDSILSAAGSSVSAASARAQGVAATRKQAEELARILDEKLGSLKVPEDGVVGVE